MKSELLFNWFYHLRCLEGIFNGILDFITSLDHTHQYGVAEGGTLSQDGPLFLLIFDLSIYSILLL